MTRGRAGRAVLPVLSGLLLALSLPPTPLPGLVFAALAPLLVAVGEGEPRRAGRGSAARWSATRAGLLTGVVFFGIQLYWIVVALIRDSLLAIPAYAGAVLVLAGLVGAFAWAVRLVLDRTTLPLALLVPLFWTLLEWVQANLGDLAFPWLGLGAGLTPVPMLAGAADVVGGLGLTFWVAAVNALLATALIRARRGEPYAQSLALAAVVLAVPASYGVIRAHSLELRAAATVAVVQPDISDEVKRSPAGLDSSLTALVRLTRSLAPGEDGAGTGSGTAELDLVVWPEVALPADFGASDALRDTVRALSRALGAPILVGAYGVDPGTQGAPAVHNSAYLVDGRRHGPSLRRYDKQRLVPFVERVPFIDLAPRRLDGSALFVAGLAPGDDDEPPLLPAAGQRFGVLICFESTFAELAREYRRDGAAFLVNITNDAWYGRPGRWGRTTALWQHPAHLVLRAIETRSGVARAANTGISMFVDPLGRTHGTTALFEATVAVDTVYTTREATLFVRWGSWVGPLVAVAALTLLLIAWRRTVSGEVQPVNCRL